MSAKKSMAQPRSQPRDATATYEEPSHANSLDLEFDYRPDSYTWIWKTLSLTPLRPVGIGYHCTEYNKERLQTIS